MLDVVIPSVIVVFCLILAIMLLRSKKNTASISYFNLMLFFAVLWSLSIVLTAINRDSEYVLLISRLSFFFPIFIGIFYALFGIVFFKEKLKLSKISKPQLLTSYLLISIGLIFAYFVFTPLVLNSVIEYSSIFGPLHPFYSLYLLFIFGYSAFIIYKGYRSATGLIKAQFHFILLGVGLSSIAAIVANLLIPYFFEKEFRYLGPLTVIFYIGFTAYAIIAHRLFDIRVIIKRTIIYSVLLAFVLVTYSVVVFSFAALIGEEAAFSPKTAIANIVAALLIALGFDPLKRWLTNITDRFLFKADYTPQEVLNKLSTTLSNVIDLDEAILSMMQIVTKEMRLKSAACFILTSYEDTTEVKRIKHTGYRNPDMLRLSSNGNVIRYFSTLPRDSAIVTEELVRDLADKAPYTRKTENIDFHRMAVKLQKLRASVALPIMVKDKLIGIFIVGDKLSDDIYSNQDLGFLKIVANQTAAAIEKARFYEEDQLKTEFVSIASHELLTPTAAIEGYLSMILDDKLVKVDGKTREFLDKIYKSSRRLAELVKDLLQVSRIEAGRIVVDQKPFDLHERIKEAVDSLSLNAKEKGVALKYIEPEKKLEQVFADPEKITQVLTNFIGNAIKYSRKEGGKAEVRVRAINSHAYRVSVADNGIGMSEETIQHLFEKFYRSPDVMSYYQGTGLGLYISKNLIEKMGGKVEVESVKDKGSTFSFTVPIFTGREERQVIGDPKLMTPDQRQAAGIEDENGAPEDEQEDAVAAAKGEQAKSKQHKATDTDKAKGDAKK